MIMEELRGKVIRTNYVELFPYFLPDVPIEKNVPYRDGFVLVKNLQPQDMKKLARHRNYLAISTTMFDEVWDRDEIIELAKKLNKSRRKPRWDDQMSDQEFIQNVKIFVISGIWPKEVDESSMFPLFEKIDSGKRFEEYFKLLKDYHPRVIMLSVLSFAKKCAVGDYSEVNSKSYLKLLRAKERTMKKNLMSAIRIYTRYKGEISEEMRVMRFIMDIGNLK